MWRSALGTQALADLQAVQARQPQVQQQHVRRLFQRQQQRQPAITRFIDAPAGTGQHGDDLRTQRRMVFGDQDVRGRGWHVGHVR